MKHIPTYNKTLYDNSTTDDPQSLLLTIRVGRKCKLFLKRNAMIFNFKLLLEAPYLTLEKSKYREIFTECFVNL
jgi:hypothetical protein